MVTATKTSCKMAFTLYQKWFKKTRLFAKKLFFTLWTIRFGSNFASMWSKYVLNNVWIDFRTSCVSICNGSTEDFYVKLTARIDFSIRHFILPLVRLKLSKV